MRSPVKSCFAVAVLALGLLWLVPPIPAAKATPGDLDPAFGSRGRVFTGGFEKAGNSVAGVALQPDGKIVAAGSSSEFMSDSVFALARYARDGSLDASFSGDGRATIRIGAFDYGSDVAIQPDGKILIFGSVGLGGEHDFGLARLNSDGSLDSTFSGDGMQRIDFGGDEESGGSDGGIALQPDGKIVVAGPGRLTANSDFALARLNRDGSLDPTFSGDGRQTTDFGNLDVAADVAVQPDGRIVVLGRTETEGPDPSQLPNAFALARYNPNGSLDSTFSGDGRQTTNFGNYDVGSEVAIQADGKIVAAGSFTLISGQSQIAYFGLARYSPNGSLDASFAGDGKQATGGIGAGQGVALQRDGKIVAVGGATDFTLARYARDGSLDSAFACRGKQRTDLRGAESASSVALYPDGRIVAAGSRANPNAGRGAGTFALARYLGQADAFPPRFTVVIRRRPRLSGLVRRGLRLRVKANEAPRVRARLVISRRRARQLGIVRGRRGSGRTPVTIGRGSARLPSACSHSRRVRLRLTRTARRRLRRASGLRATLRLRVSDAAGNTKKASRRIRFR